MGTAPHSGTVYNGATTKANILLFMEIIQLLLGGGQYPKRFLLVSQRMPGLDSMEERRRPRELSVENQRLESVLTGSGDFVLSGIYQGFTGS